MTNKMQNQSTPPKSDKRYDKLADVVLALIVALTSALSLYSFWKQNLPQDTSLEVTAELVVVTVLWAAVILSAGVVANREYQAFLHPASQ